MAHYLSRVRYLLALAGVACGASAALAQDDDAMCRNGLFPEESRFALATIGGKDRAYFHGDAQGCPEKGGECRTSSYAVPGDTVIIGRMRGGFACAYYPGDRGGTAGWIEARRLFLQPLVNRQPLDAWIGAWSSAGNPAIRFRKDLEALHVEGEAFWPGPPGAHDWPTTHEGAIDGRVALVGHEGAYKDDDLCEVRFTLLGDYLIARDNHQCGGVNVSFSGVYTRSR